MPSAITPSISSLTDSGGRLTTQSGVAVSTSDRTSQGTLYYTPFTHGRIAVYNGSTWVKYALTERSLALTLTSGKNYDVFIYSASGVLTLELSAAWTNDSTRADALTTQDGIVVKSGALTRLWLGTIRASGTNVTEDSQAKRFVWNKYNRVRCSLFVQDGAASWTYATAAYRQANANAANQVEIVVGSLEDAIQITNTIGACSNSLGGGYVLNSIGEDSTTVPHTKAGIGLATSNVANHVVVPGASTLNTLPSSIGWHKYTWLEYVTTTTTGTIYGVSGTLYRSCLTGIFIA